MASKAVARRSAPRGDMLDRTWDFFASVQNATILLFLLAAGSVAGSLIEQEGQYGSWLPPEQYYPMRYGPVLGMILMRLGLTHAYSSWWFLTLMGMVAASLVVCSLQRGVPLYRVVHRPPIDPPLTFLRHLSHRLSFSPSAGEPLSKVTAFLRQKGYRVVTTGDRLVADKGRWSRWGPYVLHLGLILVLIGALMRLVPGWYSESMVWIEDGETARIPGKDWFLRSDKFTVEYYEGTTQPKSFITEAVVIDGGVETKRHLIKMNQPLQYRGMEVYQSSYNTTPVSVDVLAQPKAEGVPGEPVRLTMDLREPASEYRVGSHTITLVAYFPDFYFDESGKPASRSPNPQNPAFQFAITGYDKRIWFFLMYPEMQFDQNAPIRFELAGVSTRHSTGLRVKEDFSIPVIWAGLTLVSCGAILAFYASHRRIWAALVEGRVMLAGQANRDTMGFAGDLRFLADHLPNTVIEGMGANVGASH